MLYKMQYKPMLTPLFLLYQLFSNVQVQEKSVIIILASVIQFFLYIFESNLLHIKGQKFLSYTGIVLNPIFIPSVICVLVVKPDAPNLKK